MSECVVKRFGAKGNGLKSDHKALESALDSGESLSFPPAVFLVDEPVTFSGQDVTFSGQAVLASPNLVNPFRLGKCTNVKFRGLTFRTDARKAEEDFGGVVSSLNTHLNNVVFERCGFTAPKANTNGLKIVSELGEMVSGFRLLHCSLYDIGRMGVEFQNHAEDEVERFLDLYIENADIRRTGLGEAHGMGLSFSGLGTNANVLNSRFEEISHGWAIENVGFSNSNATNNRFRKFGANGGALSMSGTRTMRRNRLSMNICEDQTSGQCNINSQEDLVLMGNHMRLTDAYVNMVNNKNVRAWGETYETAGAYALLLDGSQDQIYYDTSRFSNATSTANYATVRAYGAAASGVMQLRDCTIEQGTGGVLTDSQAGAAAIAIV